MISPHPERKAITARLVMATLLPPRPAVQAPSVLPCVLCRNSSAFSRFRCCEGDSSLSKMTTSASNALTLAASSSTLPEPTRVAASALGRD